MVTEKGKTAEKSSDQDIAGQEIAVKAYEKPVLIAYGDVRDVTLGPTAGLGESGCEFDRRPGSSLDCP